MGAGQSFCSINTQQLQIPTTVEEGLQGNLRVENKIILDVQIPHSCKKLCPQSISPSKSQSKGPRDHEVSFRKYEYLKYIAQPLGQQEYEGYEFPCFFISKKKVYYLGQWLSGMPHGKGRVYFINGCYFEGCFNMGKAEGEDNIFIYTDGSFYRGSFKDSNKHGFGKFYYHNGLEFSGSWLNGKPHGKDCIQKYPDGSTYVGGFVNGVKQGKGQYLWFDGKKYIGQFRNGCMQGKGLLKKAKDSYFQGHFKLNEKQGQGLMKLPYGTYEGPFSGGLMSGQGLFRWNDGRVYKGGFSNGKMHGKGSLAFNNGRIIAGEWYQGQNIEVYQISAENKL